MKRRPVKYQSFSSRKASKGGKSKLFLTIIIIAGIAYFSISWLIPNLIGGLSFINRSAPPKQPVKKEVFLSPPVLNIPFEATNSATINIKGYSLPEAIIEIYVDDEIKSTIKSAADGSFVSEDISLNLGTNNIYGKTVDPEGNKSLASKTIQVIFSNEKPQLEISQPEDNKAIQGGDKKVTVSGTTNSEKDITITINGTRVIVDSAGKFSKSIPLNDGDNQIIIVATDTSGNSTQLTRKVTYQP